jgi:phage tail sheath protein FI
MAVQVSYPGVYIEEFAPGSPIEGVGTSTAAFLGPSQMGPLNEPTKVTSWDQFLRDFGAEPLPGFYLWYAVRGFFENGGTVCHVTRVSNATFAELPSPLKDKSAGAGKDTIRVRARKPGIPPVTIRVAVDDDIHAVKKNEAKLFRPTATITSANRAAITVNNEDEARNFQSGDVLTWDGSTETKPVRVYIVEGNTIRLTEDLSGTYTPNTLGKLRLADLKPGDTTFRVENASKLSADSVIELEQDPGGGAPVTNDSGRVVKRVDVERITPDLITYRVELRQGLTKNFSLADTAEDITVESFEFKLTVSQDGAPKEYTELSMSPEHPNYFAKVIRDDPNGVVYAEPFEPPNTTPPPANRPRTKAATDLRPGEDDNPATLSSSDYKKALSLLEPIDDVNLVIIPDRTDADVQQAIISHCEKLQDRFAILDVVRGAPPFGTDSLEVHRRSLDSVGGYSALYYPWLQVSPAKGAGVILVPPSGHVAGIYARIDNNRGVHKAPAGNEAIVKGALGIERVLSDIDQGQLNMHGINIIRVFAAGARPIVWGARTTAPDADRNWQYVNIRRLFMFLEESIEEGIRWAVFEPNNLQLWQKLKRTITEFLMRVWRDGALFGETADKAFYVRIDEALNPPSTQALGRLYIEIGIRPSYPAEFIIVRIGIWQGGAEISES